MIDGLVGSLWKYGSTVFAHTSTLQRNEETIRRCYRKALLLLTRSHRTPLYLPLAVVSNTIPLDYQAINRTITYNKTRNKKASFALPYSVLSSMAKKKNNVERLAKRMESLPKRLLDKRTYPNNQ